MRKESEFEAPEMDRSILTGLPWHGKRMTAPVWRGDVVAVLDCLNAVVPGAGRVHELQDLLHPEDDLALAENRPQHEDVATEGLDPDPVLKHEPLRAIPRHDRVVDVHVGPEAAWSVLRGVSHQSALGASGA